MSLNAAVAEGLELIVGVAVLVENDAGVVVVAVVLEVELKLAGLDTGSSLRQTMKPI